MFVHSILAHTIYKLKLFSSFKRHERKKAKKLVFGYEKGM